MEFHTKRSSFAKDFTSTSAQSQKHLGGSTSLLDFTPSTKAGAEGKDKAKITPWSHSKSMVIDESPTLLSNLYDLYQSRYQPPQRSATLPLTPEVVAEPCSPQERPVKKSWWEESLDLDFQEMLS